MIAASKAISALLASQPAHIREACTPAEIFLRVYGVEAEQWCCPACGTVLELRHYPTDRCKACGRPLPKRCIGFPADRSRGIEAVKGCGTVVEPRQISHDRWAEPASQCHKCRMDVGRADRARLYASRVPVELAHTAATSYQSRAWRRELDHVLGQWARHEGGRVGGPSIVLAYGPPGTGKSMALARACHRAVVDGGVRGLTWVRERDLIDAHVDRYSRQDDRADRARGLLERAKTAELLVVDEMWASRYSDSALDEFSELWRMRLERRLPTLCATNAEPQWAVFGLHVESRFTGAGVTVRVVGSDLRRAAA